MKPVLYLDSVAAGGPGTRAHMEKHRSGASRIVVEN
jgi:hypothetical protein